MSIAEQNGQAMSLGDSQGTRKLPGEDGILHSDVKLSPSLGRVISVKIEGGAFVLFLP